MSSVIGISTNFLTVESGKFLGMERVFVNKDYVEAVEKAGGIPLLLPPVCNEASVARYVGLCDGFILSGGNDMNSLFYQTEPHPMQGNFSSVLDKAQLMLTHEILKTDKPLLAICRGAQLLNVALGGTLYQDMSEVPFPVIQHSQLGYRAEPIHTVDIVADSIPGKLLGCRLEVNSFHHQSVKDLGKGLRVVATAPDGIVEAVQLDSKPFVVGIQWHPEMMALNSDSMLPLFRALV